MPGLLSALEGFCVIGIVIGTGYVAARMRIGGPTAQMVLNRFSFFVSSPCLMFAILSKERIFEIFHSSIVVAFFSAVLVGLVFLILNRLFFHLKAADATIGALNSLYLNSNNIGLPIATYILGNPALVAPILVMQQAVFTPIGLTVLDVTTKGKVSVPPPLAKLVHHPPNGHATTPTTSMSTVLPNQRLGRTYMQPEVAFSVSAPSGGHGPCPLDSHPSGGASRQAQRVLAAPLGTPCRRAAAPHPTALADHERSRSRWRSTICPSPT